ncbi:hypothetical protein KSP40_PGU017217 [Platanthera guangdongensis]|uniref:Uncharacterized protein n=1 Tax=Platanthera guangdongensis TaxID=2320717 RepID=A0ABR2LN20_9ASPA
MFADCESHPENLLPVQRSECAKPMVGFHSSAQDDKLTVIYQKQFVGHEEASPTIRWKKTRQARLSKHSIQLLQPLEEDGYGSHRRFGFWKMYLILRTQIEQIGEQFDKHFTTLEQHHSSSIQHISREFAELQDYYLQDRDGSDEE